MTRGSIRGRADGDQASLHICATARRAISAKCSGGQRLVSHRAPRFNTMRGPGKAARVSLAHRRVVRRNRQVEPRLGHPGAEGSSDALRAFHGVQIAAAMREPGPCKTTAHLRAHRPGRRAPATASPQS